MFRFFSGLRHEVHLYRGRTVHNPEWKKEFCLEPTTFAKRRSKIKADSRKQSGRSWQLSEYSNVKLINHFKISGSGLELRVDRTSWTRISNCRYCWTVSGCPWRLSVDVWKEFSLFSITFRSRDCITTAQN